jgi:hypothetical protein
MRKVSDFRATDFARYLFFFKEKKEKKKEKNVMPFVSVHVPGSALKLAGYKS